VRSPCRPLGACGSSLRWQPLWASPLGSSQVAAVAMAFAFRSGMRLSVRWNRDEDWQARVILATATAAEYVDVMGAAPPPGAERAGDIWYCLTPDGDVYPHVLQVPPMVSVVPFDQTGQALDRTNRRGPAPAANARTYGGDWEPTPMAFLEALELATGSSYASGRPSGSTLAVSPTASPGSGSATPVPSEWVSGPGPLPDPTPNEWHVVA